jgi:hypothetical protein
MIFESPYDTMAAGHYRVGEIEAKLKAAVIAGEITNAVYTCKQTGEMVSLPTVRGGGVHSDAIPYFNHPYVFFHAHHNKTTVCVDLRPYGQMDIRQNTFKVRNLQEAQWSLMRAGLTDYWVNDDAASIRDMSILPVTAFANLFAQVITHRYALTPGDQVMIGVYSAYFYYCLFEDSDILEEEDLLRICAKVARVTHISVNKVMDSVKEIGMVSDLTAYCEQLPTFLGNPRLDNFNVTVLLQMITGTWFGTNAREVMGTALEHPPTWMMICYASLTEATYKRSTVAKLIQSFDKGGEGERFIRGIDNLVDGQAILEYLKS